LIINNLTIFPQPSTVTVAVFLLIISARSLAGEPPVVESGLTATLLGADGGRVRHEVLASFDWLAQAPMGPGILTVYLEGGTTPSAGRISGLIPEANADAGTALDTDGEGRLQVSEAHYSVPLGRGKFTAGLLDVTGFLDTSAVANDENSQFLGASFVNNPTIGFPDYTLGAAYRVETGDNQPGYALVLTRSHGSADNEASYSETLNMADRDKGVFAAAETSWSLDELLVTFGVWLNSGDHARLDGGSRTENNYGLYAVLDGPLGTGRYNLRAGLANDNVSEAAGFIAAAYEHPFTHSVTGGAGLAHIEGPDKLAGDTGDTLQSEFYLRWDVNEHVQLSPIMQYVKHPGFDASDTVIDEDVVVYGLRTRLDF